MVIFCNFWIAKNFQQYTIQRQSYLCGSRTSLQSSEFYVDHVWKQRNETTTKYNKCQHYYYYRSIFRNITDWYSIFLSSLLYSLPLSRSTYLIVNEIKCNWILFFHSVIKEKNINTQRNSMVQRHTTSPPLSHQKECLNPVSNKKTKTTMINSCSSYFYFAPYTHMFTITHIHTHTYQQICSKISLKDHKSKLRVKIDENVKNEYPAKSGLCSGGTGRRKRWVNCLLMLIANKSKKQERPAPTW